MAWCPPFRFQHLLAPGINRVTLRFAILTILMIISLQTVLAQTPLFQWAKRLGGAGTNEGLAVFVDPGGYVYTTGLFWGTVDFDPGPGSLLLTSAGTSDIFVTKFDPGGHLLWARRMGGTGNDDGFGIVVDPMGNVLTTGHYRNTVDFDPGPGVFNLTAGFYDAFISKLDASGNFVWAKKFGEGTNDQNAYSIATDAAGNVYTTGTYINTVDFDPGPAVFNLASSCNDAFVSKLNANGDFVWAKRLGGTACNDEGNGIAVDATGNVYTVGKFQGTTDFDPSAAVFNLTTAGGYDTYISKLNSNGDFVWALRVGGTTSDIGRGIVVDGGGSVIITGEFQGTGDFDPGTATLNLTSAGQYDGFIVKVDPSAELMWAGRIGGPSDDLPTSITSDGANNLYLTGEFRSTADFDPGTGVANMTATGATRDAFVIKVSQSGNGIWGAQLATTNDATGNGIAVDSDGHVISTGRFSGAAADFAPGSCVFNLTSLGGTDIYVSKLKQSSVAPLVPSITSLGPPSGLPGASVVITGLEFDPLPFNNVVMFNGTEATVLSSTATSITTTVPAGATSGTVTVAVGCNTGTSPSNFIVLTPPPTVTSFTPPLGAVGTSVTITGTNFSSTPASNTVYFGATQAAVNTATTTQLTVTVPAGATYQPISVTVNNYTAYAPSAYVTTFSGSGIIDATSFAAKVDFAMPIRPTDVTIGDLDGDSKPDVATINDGSASLSTLRNTSTVGSISFAPRVDFAAGGSSQGMEVGDIDADGKLDLISVSDAASQVSVFRNISSPGTINFAPRVNFATGATVVNVAVGDLDGDGLIDLIVCNAGSNSVSALRNTGSPGVISFAPRINLTTGGNPYDVAVADMDGDGLWDIVAPSRIANIVSVFRNTSTPGSFSFAARVDITIGAGNQPFGVALGDLNSDGKPDISLLNYTTRLFSIIGNNCSPGTIAAGNFASPVSFATSASNPTYVSLGDVSGDGKADVLVGNDNGTIIQVLKNTHTAGAFSAGSFAASVSYTTGTRPYTVRAVDIDGDERIDLAIGNGTSNTVSILRSQSGGSCVPLTERNALIALYNATDGANWTDNTGWLTDPDEDEWVGVTVSGCNVVAIDLSNNGLVGTLPPELEDLTQLTELEFFNNQLSGTLPPELASLANLTKLSLTTNQFFGDIPVELGNLTNLVTLQLGNNQFYGALPPEIGNLSALEQLHLFKNQLDGALPPEIGGLSNLQSLRVGGNYFTGNIPPELGNLAALTVLQLDNNFFDGAVPIEIGNLTNLTELLLNNNSLFGSIPIEIGNAPNNLNLALDHNFFTYLPDLTTTSLNTTFASITVNDNMLTFEDLEPNAGFSLITLGPQAKLPPGGAQGFIPGGPLFIPFATPGTDNFYQWYKDGSIVPGETAASLSLASTTAADVGFYYVRVTSSIVPGVTLESLPYTVYTDVCSPGPRTAGNLDTSFDPPTGFSSLFAGPSTQSDGKLLVATSFAVVNSTNMSGLLRFNSDGSFDNTFTPFPSDQPFVVQPNDKIIVSVNTGDLVRLEADGSPDPSFINPDYYNAFVPAIALQSDGKVVVAVNEDGSQYIDRRNQDGTDDPSFSGPAYGDVNVVRVQSDGKILIGGQGGIVRLESDGSIDGSFTAVAGDFVNDIALQSDGKIIVVGPFSYFNDLPHRGVVRLHPDGSIDDAFNAVGITDNIESGFYPNSIVIQPDGKIILGGLFETINGTSRSNIIRLNNDGTVDCAFDPEVSTESTSDVEGERIHGMVLQADGRIVISGAFESYDGTPRFGLARVNGSGATITISPQPADAIVCEGTTATFTTGASGTSNLTFQWQFSPDGVVPFVDISNGGGYANVATAVLSVNTTGSFGGGRYRCRINGDFAAEVLTADEGLFINATPPAPGGIDGSSCSASAIILTVTGSTNGNYRWYTTSTGGSPIPGEVNSTYTTPLLSTTTTYFATISISGCESATRTPVIATITVVPKPMITVSNCTAIGATLTGPSGFSGYTWSTSATTQAINVSAAGSYTLVVTSGACNSLPSDPTVLTSTFCNQPPSLNTTTLTTNVQGTVALILTTLIDDLDNNIDLTTLKVLVQPTSGAVASIDPVTLELVVDYSSTSFAGTDELTLEVCDVAGACVQRVITIEVAGDITVFNAVSPNGDGKNDSFIIQYIEALPETQKNKVTIFNRWGTVVYDVADYNNSSNVFKGLSNSGDELPSGTYFYTIEFSSGAEKRTGFISLRR